MDNKEILMLNSFKDKFENLYFDELDVYAFLIFIRQTIKGKKSELLFLNDIADVVAHRIRDRGNAMYSISRASENHYETIKGSKSVFGYNGMQLSQYNDEIDFLSSLLDINFSEQCRKELLICLMSILQFVEYKDDNHCGKMYLMQTIIDKDRLIGQLSIDTVENSDKVYVTYMMLDNVAFKKDIHTIEFMDAVYAKRIGEELQLIDSTRERII